MSKVLAWKQELSKSFLQHPEWKAPQFQSELEAALGNMAPSLSSIQKALIICRRIYGESHATSGLDTAWHLGLIDDYPMSAEAVAAIMRAISYRDKNKSSGFMTIRQAIWTSRLYAVKAVVKGGDYEFWRVPFGYALFELICELAGETPVDTTELDQALSKGIHEFVMALIKLTIHNPDDTQFRDWNFEAMCALTGRNIRKESEQK